MDKYWITFSQWHKSSAAAGFEAACGVVRHFKGSCVAPFEGMVNRGIQRALRKTSLREVTSSFLGWSCSDAPRLSLPARNRSVCLHLRPCPSFATNFLTGFIYIFPSISNRLPIVVSTVSGSLRLLSRRPIDGFLSLPMQLQPGRDQGAWVFLRICKQKETTVYSPIYW